MIVKILVCRLLVVYVGCASVIQGPTETIGFTSEPSGARLTVSGHHTMTPAYITLKRTGKHIAHFSMAYRR